MNDSLQDLMDISDQLALQQAPVDVQSFNDFMASQSMPSASPEAAISENVAPPMEMPAASPPIDQQQSENPSWWEENKSEVLKGIGPTLKGVSEGYLAQSKIQMEREMQKRKYLAELMQKMQQAKAQAPLEKEKAKLNILDQMYAALQQMGRV
jgi:hypothetical protein